MSGILLFIIYQSIDTPVSILTARLRICSDSVGSKAFIVSLNYLVFCWGISCMYLSSMTFMSLSDSAAPTVTPVSFTAVSLASSGLIRILHKEMWYSNILLHLLNVVGLFYFCYIHILHVLISFKSPICFITDIRVACN